MRYRKIGAFCGQILFITLLQAGYAVAHNGESHGKNTKEREMLRQKLESYAPLTVSRAAIELPDVELLDRNGKAVRLVSDVAKDRVVVIGFIYTSCGTVCPILSSIFSRLQHQMADRLEKDTLLISLSIDPATDIPKRLNDYARRFGADDNWRFLTGSKQNVDRVLTALGSYSFDISEHPSSVLIGDPKTGQWIRLYGFPGISEIESALSNIEFASN